MTFAIRKGAAVTQDIRVRLWLRARPGVLAAITDPRPAVVQAAVKGEARVEAEAERVLAEVA